MIKNNKSRILKHCRGLTIIELMVDLILSGIIIAALAGQYVFFKKHYTFQQDQVFLNQNAYAVFNQIKNDIKLGGFYGCDSAVENIEYAMTPTYDYTLSNVISAFDATNTGLNSSINLASPSAGWSPALQGQVSTRSPDPGSDVITVRFADTNPIAVMQVATTGATMTMSENVTASINSNDILLVSDCFRTVVFQVASVSGAVITPTQSVGTINAFAEVYKINVNSYYIKTVDSTPSLYKVTNNGTETLLVPNVENMQFLFGQDTNNDGITDKFNVASSLVSAPITSLEIGLLVRSNNKHIQSGISTTDYKIFLATSPIQTIITLVANKDNYLRRTFDFTVAFSNALIN